MFFQEEKRIAFVFSYIWSILDEKIVSDSSDVTVVARVILAVCRDDSSLFNFFGGRQCAWNLIRVRIYGSLIVGRMYSWVINGDAIA